jgi:uncharacterized protein YkwD
MLFAAVLTTVVVSVASPPAEAGTRTKMIRSINYVRSWSQRGHLSFSRHLSAGAASWARTLMRRNVLAHSARAMRRHEGEIIEWHTGPRARINSTVIEWWHSVEHRHVMLTRGYRRAGAGRAVGYFGGRRCTIWVVGVAP